MLCRKCYELFNGKRQRREDSTTFSSLFDHHPKISHIESIAQTKTCFICGVLHDKLLLLKSAGRLSDDYQKRARLVALVKQVKVLDTPEDLFHLEFKIEVKDRSKPRKDLASFILLRKGNLHQLLAPYRPHSMLTLMTTDNDKYAADPLSVRPISASTADDKVIDLAKEWLRECDDEHDACKPTSSRQRRFYPTRLLAISPPDHDGTVTDVVRVVSSNPKETNLRHPFDGDYATLSHCWGKDPFVRLFKNNLEAFQKRMEVEKLPLTFQHAIKLARRLKIQWLWIDALCIVQDDDEDWLTQSSSMREIYAQAYCNISATASQNSSQGLFRTRDMSQDWFSTATLNIPGLAESVSCFVLDLSFWNRYVHEAPVNRRSWVLQERLLSRRVLHMCQDQIAFECRSLDRAESRPKGLPHYFMLRGRLVTALNMKKMDTATGRQLHELRLPIGHTSSSGPGAGKLQDMVSEPKVELDNQARWYYYENWKRIVEDYTKMDISFHKDRLIALSGIARRIRDQIAEQGIKDENYVAGLWMGGLAGQLLWYVNPVGGDKQPLADLRPKDKNALYEYRAPSFSWASVETPRGITYGELTYDIPYRPLRAQLTSEDLKQDAIYMKVKIVRLAFRRKEDNFGIITDGYIVLKGVLRRVHLVDRHSETEVDQAVAGDNTLTLVRDANRPRRGNAFGWRLIRQGEPTMRENTIVWLDSPATAPSAFGPGGNVFAIPALRKSGALICLLVQLETTGDYGARYRRIGLTKILDVHMEAIKDILTPPGSQIKSDAKYYWGGEDQPTGESTICII